MKLTYLLAMAAVLTGLAACRSSKDMDKTGPVLAGTQTDYTKRVIGGEPQSASPVVYVYKTKKDYSHLVPVLMDEGRTRIVSYPSPGDLKRGGSLCLPTKLEQGYWLDNRGIGPSVAFLSYTYEEYSKLSVAPSMDDLMSHIVDKYPLLEIHACGRRADYSGKDIVSELNRKIAEGEIGAKAD